MEQPTTFPDQVRRRDILPVLLKIYIWLGFLLSLVGLASFVFFITVPTYGWPELWADPMFIGFFLGILVIFFTPFASLWFEFKWAVFYNEIVSVLVGLFIIIITWMTMANKGVWDPYGLIFPALFIPYWVMLFKIQSRWEKEALSKREIKKLSLSNT